MIQNKKSSCWLGALMLVLTPASAYAEAEYAVQAGSTAYRIYNPYQFPSSSGNGLKTSDNVYSTDLRAALFLPLPTDRSHLSLTGAVSKMQYDTFRNLDYLKTQYIADYDWEYSDWVRGRFSRSTDVRLYTYFGGNFTNQELPHLKENLGEVALRITPRFDIPVTLSNQSLRYTDPSNTRLYNMNSDVSQVALRYESGIKSTLSTGFKQSRVNFPDRSASDISAIDSGYTDRELFLDTRWRFAENTIVLGHLGNVQRQFATLPNRNSNIPSYLIGVDWQYSLISSLGLRLIDQPQTNEQADSRLYSVSRAVQGLATWQATPKIKVSLKGSLETQTYQTFANLGNAVVGNGTDKLKRFGARIDYDITPRLALRTEAFTEKTVSNGGSTEYSRNSVQIGLHYTFENLVGNNRARTQIDGLQ
ncbi:hypothetical protein RGU70_08000 [Herbaspirillum sp. RTI4]|uniref:hypothetical protein n=1 Tax=Herbaspirillum sp. RTI4 TaxID=3048640 RepID=UPI002AB4CAF8|nr:hypothetical protein [Herbaspirillum sp. RTI4]MDY7578261.1 hypothetical protein [Herbaspirillum sp. RTI4]MEA9981246.1 hypothetical protein [Herbaspirillum sp. RTI4]